MSVGRRTLIALAATLLAVAWLGSAPPALAQVLTEADALNLQVVQLYRQGKYAEATEIAKRVLAIRETALGPDHPSVGQSLNNLARQSAPKPSRATSARRAARSSTPCASGSTGPTATQNISSASSTPPRRSRHCRRRV
jgi:Tetratricopeptide repeat